MAAIEIEGLTKRYGDVFAVSDLDLQVSEGEVFGFLGPNGAGKSTTIDVLLDYVRPTAGTARVLGFDAQRETRRVHERVGVLPEGYGLYDRLSGRRHLALAADLKDVAVDADALLDRVGLDREAAERRVGGYSKGMCQRLALGMALVGDPDVLVMDEPTSGLDPNGAREVREIARDAADRGATVFFSSHVLGQVEAVCDRVGILRDGELVAVDTIDGLREAVGTGATLHLAVDAVPADAETALAGVDGVTGVEVGDGTVSVTCAEPGAKVAAIDRLRAAGATIRDLSTTESSLEELFSAYAGDGDGPTDPGTGAAVEVRR